VTTTKGSSERQQWNPDLDVLAARIHGQIQGEVFTRLAEAGFGDLSPRHGAILPFLDEDGIRASELVRLSGLQKQTVGRLIDELEQLGYVERQPDPADRRAKQVVPTERGLEQMRLRDGIVADIERRHADESGRRAYAQLRDQLRDIVRAG
jgi:DNA-binding MarR family transcriptional regulator